MQKHTRWATGGFLVFALLLCVMRVRSGPILVETSNPTPANWPQKSCPTRDEPLHKLRLQTAGQWTPMVSGTTFPLYAVWGSGASDVFAVGCEGTILHYDGTEWQAMDSGITEPLWALWGRSASDVFVVGGAGKILHYDGNRWGEMNSGTTVPLYGIWGRRPVDVFAVGADGIILHYDGALWREMNSGTTVPLSGIWGGGASDVFAVGEGGTILHYDGSKWQVMNSGVTGLVRGVWGSTTDDVFAVGDTIPEQSWRGIVLHYDGSAWREMSIGDYVYTWFEGVWASSASGVFVVGGSTWGGNPILHYNGSTWSEMNTDSKASFNGVWGSGPADVFAVGQGGTILHYGEFAETGVISGRVTSTLDDIGLSDVNIAARTYSRTTDMDGSYTLVVPPGVYTVKATPRAWMDYYANQRSFITVDNGETVTVDLKLTPVTSDTVDTLILANLQRMKHIGYDAGAVDQLEAGLGVLRSTHPNKTNMTAAFVDLGTGVSSEIDVAYAAWNGNEGDVGRTNDLVDSIDAYVEGLKNGDYPSLEYVIIVGSHEVIPMKARAVDSGEENDWAENLPLIGGYLYQIYSCTENGARGYYLTDSQYSDLSSVWNLRGLNSDKELIPELNVGRLVETPEQIAELLNAYLSVDGTFSSAKSASIGTSDFLDSGAVLAVDMGPEANTELLQDSFSSELIPPVLDTYHDLVYLGLHGTYNAMETRKEPGSYFVAGASSSHAGTRDISGDLSGAVIATPGCHVGVNLGNQLYHAPDGTTPEWSDFPEEFASKRVGAYLASTGYAKMSSRPGFFAYSERLVTDFLGNLLDDSGYTVGEAYRKAVHTYIGVKGSGPYWSQNDKTILAVTTLYGIPNYRSRLPSEASNYPYQTTPSAIRLMPQWSEQAPVASEASVVLNLTDWELKKDGTVQLPHASLSGQVGEPVLPIISIERTLPPGSTIRKVVQRQDDSSYIDIENDIPLAEAITLNASGDIVTETGTFTYTDFFPETTAFTITLGTANEGTSSSLQVVPVQYNRTTHATRIWTHLSFDVEYDLGGSKDSDGDGLPDYWEEAYGLDAANDSGDNGADADVDGDGLTNVEEYHYSTNPKRVDTDDDGVQDRTEIMLGTDPNNPFSRPHLIFLPIVTRDH